MGIQGTDDLPLPAIYALPELAVLTEPRSSPATQVDSSAHGAQKVLRRDFGH